MSRASVAALVCAAQFTMLLVKASGSPQIRSTTEPSFEVSTIKPVPPRRPVTLVGGSCHGTDSHRYSPDYTPPPLGRCLYTNITLRDLLKTAYAPAGSIGDGRSNVTGAPSWVGSEPWDIQAKAEDTSVTESELKRMLQVLIKERFKLQFHLEKEEVQGLVLVIGKSGPKLTEDHSDSPQRAYFNGQEATFQNSRLEDFARFISGPIGLPVFDKTGLTASYRFTFHIPPRQTGDADSPSIFTAVEEQLGLRLQSAKVPLDVFVIEHAEKPITD